MPLQTYWMRVFVDEPTNMNSLFREFLSVVCSYMLALELGVGEALIYIIYQFLLF